MNGVKTVAVLMGGIGSEREVSLQSGAAVVTALEQAGFTVVPVDIHPEDLSILNDPSIDVFFPALHGTFGEDGRLQDEFERRGCTYVGSGARACELAFDKLLAKEAFHKVGVRSPQAFAYNTVSRPVDLAIDQSWVVKPVREGSSVGVSIVPPGDDVLAVAQKTCQCYGDCMIEQYIAGREVTVGIVLNNNLPVIEIKPQEHFYDYQAKYLADDTDYLFDTLNPALATALQTDARRCFDALGMRHFGRIDFLIDAEDRAWVLEANAIPGLTSHSLLPKAARKVEQSMPELCLRLVEAAALELPT